jgi:pyruvate dehydrogenase E2 component (dihydrolipoamide acetyltransferase)
MKMSVRRKLAIASWSAPREGNIYGKLSLEATQALRYIEHLRATSGEHVTITHFVGKAVGMALAACPSLNGRIVWGRFEPHKTVDVAFLVALEGGKNLAKVKVDSVDQITTAQLCASVRSYAERLRAGKDEAFNKSQNPLTWMPTWLIRPVLWVTGWLTGALGVSVPALGLEAFPFGGGIVTSVGMFGLDEGFVPPTPFARVPVYVLIGAIGDTPVVREGEVVIRKMITLTATIDHRFIDGAQGAVLAKTLRACFEAPWTMDGLEACPYGDD